MSERRADIATRVNTISASEYIKAERELLTAERDITRIASELAAAKGVKAGIFRRVKKAGGDVEAMRLKLKLSAMDDDERNRMLENVEKMAAWTGVTIWRVGTPEEPQGDLLGAEAQAEAKKLWEARILTDGYNSRRHGGPREDNGLADNPHIVGTEAHTLWAKGWLDAHKQLGEAPAPTKAVARRKPVAEGAKKRGRPPGSGNKPKAAALN